MPKYKYPGVYVEEVPSLPRIIAEVNSAVPAFIGYTQRTFFEEKSMVNQPTKIQSMLEFENIFGKSAPFKIANCTEYLAATETNATVENQYYLYDSVQLYFLNGGGPCYIVSIGSYPLSVDETDFETGLNALDLFDEPTLYLIPDAVNLDDDGLAKIQKFSLKKCSELRDRFSILDVKMNTDPLQNLKSVSDFREKIGLENLKYGAAYTPWLKTTLEKNITANSITGIFNLINKLDPAILNKEINGNPVRGMVKEYENLLNDLSALKVDANIAIIFKDFEQNVAQFSTSSYSDGTKNPFDSGEIFNSIFEFTSASNLFQTFWDDEIKSLITNFKNNYIGTPAEKEEYLHSLLNKTEMTRFKNVSEFVSNRLKSTLDSYELLMIEHIPYYSNLLKILKNKATKLPPSGAMAGIYCKIDRERGVWKAPANISLNGITGVSQSYSDSELSVLNVDDVAGKSINVIRLITGHGIMVMGARTLAGNDSEWRYIPVRRLFIFIEENLKKSTAWVVFEPNNQILWLKVKSQIENYFYEIWRKGALAGAKSEQAYYVRCGLNNTMNAQEVLEGKLIIEIGLAAVRPSEFIVLKFSHQLQKS